MQILSLQDCLNFTTFLDIQIKLIKNYLKYEKNLFRNFRIFGNFRFFLILVQNKEFVKFHEPLGLLFSVSKRYLKFIQLKYLAQEIIHSRLILNS